MKKFRPFILILSIIGLIVSLTTISLTYLSPYIIKRRIPNSFPDSIGIIGSADGPTSIFISSSHFTSPIPFIIIGLSSVLGILYFILSKKKTQ